MVRVIHQENSGPSGARNRGVMEARGAILAFTDDDCLPTPEWLESLVKALSNHPDVVVGGITFNGLLSNIYSETSQLILTMVYEHFNSGPNGAYFLASNNIACRRALYRAAGGFDTEFPVPGAEDREFCDRCRMQGVPLIWVRDARLEHRHDQTLKKFLSLHYRYGRGAYRYQAKRRRRNSGTMAEDLSFHRSLPRKLFRKLVGYRFLTRLAISVLLVLWQLSNAMGFVYEVVNDWYNSRRRINSTAG